MVIPLRILMQKKSKDIDEKNMSVRWKNGKMSVTVIAFLIGRSAIVAEAQLFNWLTLSNEARRGGGSGGGG